MTDEEIIEKLMNNTWWPFDQVDPKLIRIADERLRQKEINDIEEAPL